MRIIISLFEQGLLLPCDFILVIAVVIRAAVVRSLQKSVHFVLIEIYEADIALILVIVVIIYAFIAV